ncbi:arf-GAP domain and FG repeat-containing protein 1 isoform X2 [Chelonus insularis]|uniref:arf-GAP domain and FG repeat-containing protein 1 isoform X2 n=1 Tax=Chelonus insularis TaxID=460826 RepID=UPI00158F18D9|nr:arf-GAP domain and FG repeat-containing protein 1 isoform X2 [Chelonus insularis]
MRGLTPPHRVKSISMATFTPEEIEFLKQRGNEYCKKIWLGLMNSNTPLNIDTKDEQKMKDLMSAKYEHKRYYLDPSMANDSNANNQKTQSLSSKSTSPSSTSLTSSPNNSIRSNHTNIPRVQQVGTLPALNTPTLNQKKKNITETPVTFPTDFVADFSQVPDPFVAATPTSRFPGTIDPQPSFANFDNNPAFHSNSSDLSNSFNQIEKPSVSSNLNGINAPPPEDRYAALKDLDSLMKKTQLKEDPPTNVSSTWTANNSNSSNSVWMSNDQLSHVISNPFCGNDLWRPSLHVINNNNSNSTSNNNYNNIQPLDNSFYNSANPFRQQISVNNESQWKTFGTPSSADVIASSQLMTPLSGKVWHPTVPPYQANPFMVGTGVGNPARSSNNPFL